MVGVNVPITVRMVLHLMRSTENDRSWVTRWLQNSKWWENARVLQIGPRSVAGRLALIFCDPFLAIVLSILEVEALSGARPSGDAVPQSARV